MKKFHLAEAQFREIISIYEAPISEIDVSGLAYKAYERMANLHYEVLGFKTAHEYLQKGEEIVNRLYGEEDFERLEYLKKKSLYFKKF